ncbi:MAG: AAA family ATPase [Proteobacteria bacterium]|nr:MAG: AAA family ATPase [Pseudomonadota bacterium]
MLNSLLGHPRQSAVRALDSINARLNEVVLGKERIVRLGLACVLARGHLLIEDRPGVGKTTLAHALARVLGLDFNRVQFTSDMLPADVIGVSVFDTGLQAFSFHPGPVFNHVVLADEINRATPRAQSALLEAMEERQVSVDGTTHALPDPFYVIATQNPYEQTGSFPLPESQLDRFMMTVSMGFPDRESERALLNGRDRGRLLEELEAVTDAAGVIELQRTAEQVHASDALTGYVLDLLEASRAADWVESGLSRLAGLALLRSARAWALLQGRDTVIPEDVQEFAPAVIGHRIAHNMSSSDREALARRLIESVAID